MARIDMSSPKTVAVLAAVLVPLVIALIAAGWAVRYQDLQEAKNGLEAAQQQLLHEEGHVWTVANKWEAGVKGPYVLLLQSGDDEVCAEVSSFAFYDAAEGDVYDPSTGIVVKAGDTS